MIQRGEHMALNYTVYQYDGSRNAVVMTDMEGKELVIDCDQAEEQVVFDEPADAGILARLARKEPANYVSIAMRPGGLQDYVDVWNELNQYIPLLTKESRSVRMALS